MNTRPVRQSALKARKRIASYYNKNASSENRDTTSGYTKKHYLFIDQLQELFNILEKPSSNYTIVQHKLVYANEIYGTLIRHSDILVDLPKLHKTMIETMTRNESELDRQMESMTNITSENLSLLETLKQNMQYINNKDICNSITGEINTIRNQTYNYRIYIRDMVKSITEKIKTLRTILNKNK